MNTNELITLKVDQIMTVDVKTVIWSKNMFFVEDLMLTNNIHHVPVVNDENEVQGIISRSDIEQLRHWATKYDLDVAKDSNKDMFRSMLAKDVMNANVVMVKPTHTLGDCVSIFKENYFHCLPVVKEKKLVGIITPYDLVNFAYRKD